MYKIKIVVIICVGLSYVSHAMEGRGGVIPVAQTLLNKQLFEAVSRCESKLIPTLVAYGADPNAKNSQGETVLEKATIGLWGEQQIKVFQNLIQAGANLLMPFSSGDLPFVYAIGRDLVVANLLRRSSHVDSFLLAIANPLIKLCAAVLLGDENTVNQLCDADAQLLHGKLEDRNCTPLMLASLGGHLPIVRNLLQRNALVDEEDLDGGTALTYALNFKDFPVYDNGIADEFEASSRDEVALFLIDRGVKLNSNDKNESTPCGYAARYNRLSVLTKLLQLQPTLANEGVYGDKHPLCIAARHGHKDSVELLLNAGAHIEARTKGLTALALATIYGHTQVGELLLARGAQIDTLSVLFE